MKRWCLLIVLTMPAGAACSKPPSPVPAVPEGAQPVQAPPDASRDLLRVDPGMLRDLRMTTTRVEERTGSAEVDMLGALEVDRDNYAEVAPPIDAQVVRLLASVNGDVRRGQSLAELRSPELGRARADVLTAEARLQLASQVLERKRALAAERIVPLREVQEAESQAREAEATVRAAVAGLRALGATPDDTSPADDPARFFLRAPIEGTVLERHAATGGRARAAEPMFRIANLARVWLVVHAFERDAVQLVPRTAARITLAAMPGREFDGRVALIGREVDPSSRTVDVRIELPNVKRELRPGMSATAHIQVQGGSQRLLSVPAAAMQRVGEEWVVFVPQSEGVFRIRPVGRGRDLGGEVEVQRGIAAGETVVVDGAFLLKSEAEKAASGDHDHD